MQKQWGGNELGPERSVWPSRGAKQETGGRQNERGRPGRSCRPGEALGLDSESSRGPWRVAGRKMICTALRFLIVPLGTGWRVVRAE